MAFFGDIGNFLTRAGKDIGLLGPGGLFGGRGAPNPLMDMGMTQGMGGAGGMVSPERSTSLPLPTRDPMEELQGLLGGPTPFTPPPAMVQGPMPDPMAGTGVGRAAQWEALNAPPMKAAPFDKPSTPLPLPGSGATDMSGRFAQAQNILNAGMPGAQQGGYQQNPMLRRLMQKRPPAQFMRKRMF